MKLISSIFSLAIIFLANQAVAGEFKIHNCLSEQIFVCTYDKTDSSKKIPYNAKSVKGHGKKLFACASPDKCQIIVGISKVKQATGGTNEANAVISANQATGGGSIPVINLAAQGIVAVPFEFSEGVRNNKKCMKLKKALDGEKAAYRSGKVKVGPAGSPKKYAIYVDDKNRMVFDSYKKGSKSCPNQ